MMALMATTQPTGRVIAKTRWCLQASIVDSRRLSMWSAGQAPLDTAPTRSRSNDSTLLDLAAWLSRVKPVTAHHARSFTLSIGSSESTRRWV